MHLATRRRNGLHISTLTPKRCRGYLLYVHGGPGSHSAYFEAAAAELPAYNDAAFGWICYDQRSCGRSEKSQTPSHEGNIADLAELTRHLKNDGQHSLLGVVGHSYGGWLAFHTLAQHSDLKLALAVVASARDMRTAKNHSFAMDMLELRLDQPEVYAKLLPELENLQGPLWEFQLRIRKEAAPLKRRPLFMWGNLATMAWYNALKERVGMAETWEIAHEIASRIDPKHLLMPLDPAVLSTPLLRVMGVHDFLMDGDQYYPGQKTEVVTFFKSGHYPHLEESERFLEVVGEFFAAEG